MTNIKKFFVFVLAFAVVALFVIGTVIPVYADYSGDTSATEENTVAPDISLNYDDIDELVISFKKYLKGKYGEDYEYYYNLIIEQWGSVEAYLLSLGNKLPEEYKSGWDMFIGWLGEYSVIWAPALAVLIVIVVAVVGKKSFNIIVDKIVNVKLSPIVKELNSQSAATVSVMRAQRALLGNNERFAENVKELEESERRLASE